MVAVFPWLSLGTPRTACGITDRRRHEDKRRNGRKFCLYSLDSMHRCTMLQGGDVDEALPKAEPSEADSGGQEIGRHVIEVIAEP